MLAVSYPRAGRLLFESAGSPRAVFNLAAEVLANGAPVVEVLADTDECGAVLDALATYCDSLGALPWSAPQPPRLADGWVRLWFIPVDRPFLEAVAVGAPIAKAEPLQQSLALELAPRNAIREGR